MGDLVRVDFTLPARPRRETVRYVHRCKRCRVPLAAGGFCGHCTGVIEAEGDALRYGKLLDAAARQCVICLWTIPARERVAVDLATLDVAHACCVEERELERVPVVDEEAERAGESAS